MDVQKTGLLWYWRKLKNMTIHRQILKLKKVLYLFFYDFYGFVEVYSAQRHNIASESVNHTESKNMCIVSVCSDLTQLPWGRSLSTSIASMSCVSQSLLSSELNYITITITNFALYLEHLHAVERNPPTPQWNHFSAWASDWLAVVRDEPVTGQYLILHIKGQYWQTRIWAWPWLVCGWVSAAASKLRTVLAPSCSATEGVSGHCATCQRRENTASVLSASQRSKDSHMALKHHQDSRICHCHCLLRYWEVFTESACST